jgi:hypothetical protein
MGNADFGVNFGWILFMGIVGLLILLTTALLFLVKII